MAILYNAPGEQMTHVAAAPINSLDTRTMIFILQPTTIDPGDNNRRLAYKGSLQVFFPRPNGLVGAIRFFKNRATTGSNAISVANTFTANNWQFCAMVDGDGVTPQIWHGAYPTKATEVTYDTQTTGSGAPTDDSGNDLDIGGRDSGSNLSSESHLAVHWIYDVILTEKQVLMHQYDPGLVLANCVLKVIHGLSGTNNHADLSGNGISCVVEGGSVSDHVPLRSAFSFDVPWIGVPTVAVISRIMGAIAGQGGLAGIGGLAGRRGGIAG